MLLEYQSRWAEVLPWFRLSACISLALCAFSRCLMNPSLPVHTKVRPVLNRRVIIHVHVRVRMSMCHGVKREPPSGAQQTSYRSDPKMLLFCINRLYDISS